MRAGRRGSPLRLAVFGLAVVIHLCVLYWPSAPSTGGIPIDKLVHAAIFGGVLWAGARAGLPIRALIAVLAAHAVASELIQHYLLAGRTGDPFDTLADLSGVAIVTAVLRRESQLPAAPADGGPARAG